MSLGRSVYIYRILEQFKMTCPNIDQLTISDLIDYFDELFVAVLKYPAPCDRLIRSISDQSSADNIVEPYAADLCKILKTFKSRGLPFIRKCYKKLKAHKNTMHVLYKIYTDLNDWIICINNNRNSLTEYANKRNSEQLNAIVKQINDLYDDAETKALLLFRAIKHTMIKNDNVFNLHDILDEEAEFDEVQYITPHLFDSINQKAPSCFKKLYEKLLSLVEKEMPIDIFSKICRQVQDSNSAPIKRYVMKSLQVLGQTYRDIYNNTADALIM